MNELLLSALEHYLLTPHLQKCEPWPVFAVVPDSHHHLCCYLLGVVQRLHSHLSAVGPTQVDQPCDVLDATNQLQKLQKLLETRVLHLEQGPSR